jgi:hypothetical protein
MATDHTKKEKILEINFTRFGGPVFVGRENGEAARKKVKLDSLEDGADRIVVLIPEGTYSVNSSFFLGLFDKSIKKVGSRDGFLTKFEMNFPRHLKESIDAAIERALLEKKLLVPKE